MRDILALLVLSILVLCLDAHPSIHVRETERRADCHGCNDECDQCEYGVIISAHCGVLQCRKGPDEHCGGLSKGVCGDGMICLCERCMGCSIDNLKCSKEDHPCLPNAPSYDPHYMDMLHNNRITLLK